MPQRRANPVLSCGVLVLAPAGELLLGHATGTPRWDIPKGIAEPDETPVQTALRETVEETGLRLAVDELLDLGCHAYRRGKDLHLFAVLRERFDTAGCACRSTFVDRHGRSVPELDRFAWIAFDDVPARCGRSLAALLGALDLAGVLARLERRSR
ncbi:MAG: NUDIX domain-containing protein [Betaproteobacteria bacterium]